MGDWKPNKYTITVEPGDPHIGGYVAACGVNGGEPDHFGTGETPGMAIVHLGVYLIHLGDPLPAPPQSTGDS